MDKYMYPSLKARIQAEYKIYLLAFLFIAIADKIGQIKIPFGLGTFILFPIFYSLILGILSGPQVAKIVKSKEVKAASKLVIVAICPFIAKLGINAGASIETVISAGPALLLQEFGNLGTIFLAMPLALMLGLKREASALPTPSTVRPTWPSSPICTDQIHRRPAAAFPSMW